MVRNISPAISNRDESFFKALSLACQYQPICHSFKSQSFAHKTHRLKVNRAQSNCSLALFLFSPFFPCRSGIPPPLYSMMCIVRSWWSVAVIFVSSLFSSSFCSELGRARIKAPQGTTTSTPLIPFIARRPHMFNPLPHRDPTSNRKKNRTVPQPQKGRL